MKDFLNADNLKDGFLLNVSLLFPVGDIFIKLKELNLPIIWDKKPYNV
jgi:hypothetical protein